jgi:uncharacterized CHY-type Zn-finger protein
MGYIVHGNLGSDKVTEQDCIACSHCQAVVLVEKYQAQGGWCWGCGKPICYPCAEHAKKVGRCEPWNKQMDELVDTMERQAGASRGGILI